MAQTSFPFDSQTSTESDWSHIFRQLTATTGGGVEGSPATNELKVTADSSGMNVKIAAGSAIVRGHMYINDAQITLTVGASSSNPRIDVVVLELDPTANQITAKLIAGTAAVSPVAPTLTQTDTAVYQLPLGQVYVGASVSTISAGNVTDVRPFAGYDVGLWTTATRPTVTASQTGLLGYNTTTQLFEYWNGTGWNPVTPTSLDAGVITSGVLPIARGGTGQSSFASGFIKSNGTTLSGGNGVIANDITSAEQANIVAGTLRSGGVVGGTPIVIHTGSTTPTYVAGAINLWFNG